MRNILKSKYYIITEQSNRFRVRWVDDGVVEYFPKSYDTFTDVDDLAYWLDFKYSLD